MLNRFLYQLKKLSLEINLTKPVIFFLAMGFISLNTQAINLNPLKLTHALLSESDGPVLSGKITDKSNGTPLPGAVISIPDLHNGSIADDQGNYILSHVPKGTFLVQVSFIGYASLTMKVNFTSTVHLDFQLQPSSLESKEVIVTGVGRAAEIERSPIPIISIDKKFINERAGASNIIDAIANLPGVNAVSTGPNVSKPFIRGLGFNRVITLADGIRQEGQQWGEEHGVEVDQFSIDRIEVIKGPASLTYGSDAVGGVVNLLPPQPVPNGIINGSLTGLFGTNQGLYTGSARTQGNINGLVWLGIFSAKGAKDYDNQHDGRVYGSAYKERDARLMVGLNKEWGYSYLNASLFDDLQEIPDGSRDSLTRRFTRQVVEEDDPKIIYVRPIVSDAALNSYAINSLHQHVQHYRLYNNTNLIIGDANLVFNLGYQFSHRREFSHPVYTDIPGLNLGLHTFNYDAKYNFTFGDGYESSIGINGMYQKNGIGGSTDFIIPSYTLFDLGPFIYVKKSIKKLDLSAGIRYDSRSFSNDAVFTGTNSITGLGQQVSPQTINAKQLSLPYNHTFHGLSGSLGATYNFTENFLIKADLARGFRSPNIAEISAHGVHPGTNIYQYGNLSFNPEFSLQEDLGMFTHLKEFSLSIEIFNNNITNYIYNQKLLNSKSKDSIIQGNTAFQFKQTNAQIFGAEMNLDIHPSAIPWLHFENAFSLTRGIRKGINANPVPDSLKNLPFIPPFHSHSELKLSMAHSFAFMKEIYLNLGFDHYSAQKRFFEAYGTETATAGYNLLSMGLGGKITDHSGKALFSLFIEGTNLTNQNYQSHLSRLKYFDNQNVPPGVKPGIFNMGRNLSFKVIVPLSFKG